MKNTDSLKKNRDFVTVYRTGRSQADRRLVLYKLKNGTDKNRLGISVSKKVGNSVVRHRVKRLVKEAYRLEEENYRTGYDLIFVARAGAKDSSFNEIASSVKGLCRRMHLASERPEKSADCPERPE